jgi:molybdopterin-guanine dinucleotide biosynthesis protein A
MACDMPFVSSELLLELLARFRRTGKAVFVTSGHGCGFPCLVPVAMEGLVAALIGRGEWALQDLVATLPSERLRVRRGRALVELMNVNTTAELAAARERLRTTSETQV